LDGKIILTFNLDTKAHSLNYYFPEGSNGTFKKISEELNTNSTLIIHSKLDIPIQESSLISQKQLLASTTLSMTTKLSNKPKKELKNRQKNASIDDFGLRSSSHNIKPKITHKLNKKNKSKDDFDIEYKYSEKFTNKK